MKESMDKLTRSMKEYFSNLTKKEKIRFALLALSVIILAIVAAYLLGRTTYVPVYSGLDTAEAGKYRAAIEEMGYTVKTQGTGTLLVPEGTEDEIRQKLAAEGYGASAFTYDLFNSASGFGMTDEATKTALRYQAQEHLQSMINNNVKVKSSLVMIVQPETSSFIRTRSDVQPSVSAALVLEDGVELTSAEARNMAQTIQNALPGLERDNITITDQYLNLYILTDEYDASSEVETRIQLEQMLAAQYENSLKKLLMPVFELENFQVAVNVRMTMDEESTSSVIFAPPVDGETEGLAVSLSRLYESTRTNGDAAEGVPGTDENGMNTVTYPEFGLAEDETYHKYAEDVNYEINETRTLIEKEKGRVTALTCSVVFNSDVITGDYTDLVLDLASKTIGVDASAISVQSMPFRLADATVVEPSTGLQATDVRQIIETAINAVVVLLLALALFGLIRTIFRGSRPQQVVLADGTGMNVDYVAGGSDMEGEEEEETLAEISSRYKSESIVQLENFIDKDAEAVAMLLRNWLAED